MDQCDENQDKGQEVLFKECVALFSAVLLGEIGKNESDISEKINKTSIYIEHFLNVHLDLVDAGLSVPTYRFAHVEMSHEIFCALRRRGTDNVFDLQFNEVEAGLLQYEEHGKSQEPIHNKQKLKNHRSR